MTIFSPCTAQKRSRSGTRAMVPSSFMISQITPAEYRPASRARSTAASVWPVRSSTPPARARRGKHVPRAHEVGRARAGVDRRLDRARPVVAEMPVETPVRASIETVNAVPKGAPLRAVIGARPSASQRSGVSARQISPRPCRRHEVDVLRRRELGGERQVSLVLAILGVADDDHLPGAHVLQRRLDRAERSPWRSRFAGARAGDHAPAEDRPPPQGIDSPLLGGHGCSPYVV